MGNLDISLVGKWRSLSCFTAAEPDPDVELMRVSRSSVKPDKKPPLS
ncbi:MAG: hypothetical protein ACFB0G_20975 [Leptolyngbyaceae cyanobacterium]